MTRHPTQYVALSLPAPISTNNLFINVNGGARARVKSQRYKAWLLEAGIRLNTQRPGRIEGFYELRITVSSKCRLDLDNSIKATADLLQKHGVVSNDRLCRSLKVKFGDVDGMDVMVIAMVAEAAE